MISPARRSPIRGARFFSRFPILRRPAWRKASGVGQARSRSNTAGWSRRGPRTRSRAGWIWVSRPSDPVRCCVACFAKSSSKPQSMVSSASCSSAIWMERSVWGMVRAASAMMNASRASVFASPGCRSAIRRIASPGRYPTVTRAAWATATGSAPIVAGWSTTSRMRAVLAQRVSISRSRASSLGKALSKSFIPGRVHGNGVVFALADVQADEDINAFVVSDHLYLPVTAADTCAGLSAVSEPASTLRTTIPNCPASISGLSGTYRTPVTTPPGSLTTGGGNHAGVGRPAHPHPATGTGYEKGNGGGTGGAD